MSDKITLEILESLRDGSHKAFEVVFIAYFNKITVFIFGCIKSEADAEELAEVLFVNLWINKENIDTSKSFNSYLHTIAQNSTLNFLKNKYLHTAYVSNSSTIEYSSTSEEDLIAKELGLQIDYVIEKMPAQRKQIYILSRNKGLSNLEIADQLNALNRNVESQLSLALKEIRKVMDMLTLPRQKVKG